MSPIAQRDTVSVISFVVSGADAVTGRRDGSFQSGRASSNDAAVLELRTRLSYHEESCAWREYGSEGEDSRRESRVIEVWSEHVRHLLL